MAHRNFWRKNIQYISIYVNKLTNYFLIIKPDLPVYITNTITIDRFTTIVHWND
jgi:hypothetical protein